MDTSEIHKDKTEGQVSVAAYGHPKVSILMAVYNAEAYLDHAIESVTAQSMPDWQLICVDDASTDSSWHKLQQYAERDSRVQVLHKEKNEGQAVARNEALQVAKGEYVTMLDADDWLSSDCLQLALNAFTPQTDTVVLDLVQHFEKDDSAEGREERYAIPYLYNNVISGYDAFIASLDWKLHGLYVVRRDLHLLYPYDTSCHLFSDDNTTRLHYLHSREVRFCEGRYYYRKHPDSCTNIISADRFLYMEANLSMRNMLLKEGVSQEVLDDYESHRWLNYIGQIWLYVQHKGQLTPSERQQIRKRFEAIYHTFKGNPVAPKFGYTHFRNYNVFLLQEFLYFGLRKMFREN